MSYFEKFGPIFGRFVATKFLVFIGDRELAKKVLLNTRSVGKFGTNLNRHIVSYYGKENVLISNGDIWKQQRTMVNPAFVSLSFGTDELKSNVSLYLNLFKEKTKEAMKILEKQPIVEDSLSICQNFTLDALGKSIFGFDFKSMSGKTQKELQAYNTIVENGANPIFILFPFLTRIPSLPYNKMFSGAVKILLKLYDSLIMESKEKMKKRTQPSCMLDFMVNWMENNQMEHNLGTSENLLRNNVSVFFIAGHDTTATALTFAIYALAKHPDVQEKSRKEVQQVLGNEEQTFENLQNLQYLQMVIQETMRMYPPVGNTTLRETEKNIQIGDYKIPKGVSFTFNCIYSLIRLLSPLVFMHFITRKKFMEIQRIIDPKDGWIRKILSCGCPLELDQDYVLGKAFHY